MKPTQSGIAPPVHYAAEIAFELNQMRGECCTAAARAMASPSDQARLAVEECAWLDEALAVAHRALQSALKRIVVSRARRSKA